MNWRIRHLAATASTNDDAKHAAALGEAEGLVIVAERQTSGRGRHGRVWESPVGNLYCSILLRPSKHIPQYSFVAALAVYETVHALLPHATVMLKWPNDVLVDGKKIAGILLEAEEGALVAGIGLNIAHHPDTVLYPSTSLAACGFLSPPRPEDILPLLLERLRVWHETVQTNGFAPVRTGWLKHAHTGRMTVRLPQEEVTGTFMDIDEQGHLRLKLADGTERVIATGDVFPHLGA